MVEKSLTVRLRANISDFNMKMSDAGKTAVGTALQIGSAFQTIGPSVGDFANKLTTRLTLPIGGAAAASGKLAKDFNHTMSNIVTLAGVGEDAIDGLQESIFDLSAETGRGPRELGEALYFAASAGYEAEAALAIVKASARAASVGLGDTTTIVDAVTGAIGAYGEANLSASEAIDVLLGGVQAAKVEASEFTPQLGRLLAMASTLGVGFDQTVGAFAFLTQTMNDAGLAGTAMQGVLQKLLVPSAQGKEALKKVGESAESIRKSIAEQGLIGTLDMLEEKFKGNEDAIFKLFDDVQAFNGALALMRDANGKLVPTMQATTSSAGNLGKALSQIDDSDAHKLDQAWAQFQVSMIKFGQAILPIAADIAAVFAAVARAVDSLPEPFRNFALAAIIATAALGPMIRLLMLFSPLITAIAGKFATGRLLQSIQGIGPAGRSAETGLRAMNAGFSHTIAMAGKTTLALAAATAAIDFFADRKNRADQVRAVSTEFFEALKATSDNTQAVNEKLEELVQRNADVRSAFYGSGATIDEFREALMAGGEALLNFEQKLANSGGDLGEVTDATRVWSAAIRQAQGDLLAFMSQGDGLTRVVAGLTPEAAAAGQAMAYLGIGGKNAAGGISDANAEVGEFVSLADLAAEAAERLAGTFDSLFAQAFNVGRASDAFADSLTAVDEAASATTGGGSVRDLERDQRNLEKATRDVTRAQQDLEEAQRNLIEVQKGATAAELARGSLSRDQAKLAVDQARRALLDARESLDLEIKKGKRGDVAGAQLRVRAATLALRDAQLRQNETITEWNDLQRKGKAGSDELADAVKQVEDAQDALTDATDRLKDAEKEMRGEADGGPIASRHRNIARAVDQVISSAKDWINELILLQKPQADWITALDTQKTAVDELKQKYAGNDGIIKILNDYLEVLEKIAFFRFIGPGPNSGIPDFVGPHLLGTPNPIQNRATGGRAEKDTPYWVGENGRRELFVPDVSGTIFPESALSTEVQLAMTKVLQPVVMNGGGGDLHLKLETVIQMNRREIAKAVVDEAKAVGGLPILLRPV